MQFKDNGIQVWVVVGTALTVEVVVGVVSDEKIAVGLNRGFSL